jgi:hypothetical protein
MFARATEGWWPPRAARFEALAGPRVLQVVRTDDSNCLWVFSEQVVAVSNAAGLHTTIGGDADAPRQVGLFGVTVQYAGGDPIPGSAWDTVLENVDIEFASGNPLIDGDGDVVQ